MERTLLLALLFSFCGLTPIYAQDAVRWGYPPADESPPAVVWVQGFYLVADGNALQLTDTIRTGNVFSSQMAAQSLACGQSYSVALGAACSDPGTWWGCLECLDMNGDGLIGGIDYGLGSIAYGPNGSWYSAFVSQYGKNCP